MFVMLLGSFTYAQTFDFSCIDYVQLRADRVSELEALGNDDFFVAVGFQDGSGTNSDTTVVTISKGLTEIVDFITISPFVEYLIISEYETFYNTIKNKVHAQILRTQRIAELEAAFIQYGTSTVNISLIKDNDGNDAILFSNSDGTITLDVKFNELLENLPSTTIQTTIVVYFNTYVNLLQGEIDAAAAAAKTAALEANETAYEAALNSNTATSTLDRETELEGLSRDGIYVKVVFPSSGGFSIEFHDINGQLYITYDDGTTEPMIYSFLKSLDSVSNYGTSLYNNQVTRVRDLVKVLINN